MLETEIKKLTAAVEANTAALGELVTGAIPPAASDAKPAPAPTPAAAAVTAQAEPAPAPAAAEAPAEAPAETPAAEAVTKKQLVEKFVELAKGKGREVASRLLAEYKIAKLPELKDETVWPEFYAKMVSLLEA